MSTRTRAVLLIVIQCLIVSSVAGKYLYERITRPRVWVRVTQYDPNLPMRGRYLALSPQVDACSLPRDETAASNWQPYQGDKNQHVTYWSWRVLMTAKNGKLVVEDARNVLPHSDTQQISLASNQPCECAPLSPVDFFISDTAKSPFPLKKGEELWAEVTVPPAGPPRPIQLAISGQGQWNLLKFD
jgi:hypothetical protein